MRIQHNILAMNAYRNYNANTAALGKNLEKLSSGYKINRAGDDAAGLAISEKMRAQITGLNAASKNVKDGISLVKTAEGAMQEIQDMLNRMDYLATQSANGTYDNEVDRANLQKEVDALKTEINRIADSANFNGIKLLDGSLDKGAVSGVKYNKLSAADIKGLLPKDMTGTVQGDADEIGDKGILETDTSTPATDASFEISLDGIGDVTVEKGGTFTLKVGDGELSFASTDGGTYDGAQLAAELEKAAAATTEKGFTFETGGDVYTVKAEDGTLKFTCADATKKLNASAAVTWKADPAGTQSLNELNGISTQEGDGDDTSTAPTVTDPTSKTIDATAGTADSAGKTAIYSYNLNGLQYAIPDDGTTLTFNVAGKDYDVAVAKNDDAAAIAGKLVTAINKDQPTDETVGAYTAAVDKTTNTKITLTSAKKGEVDSALTGNISVKDKKIDAAIKNVGTVNVAQDAEPAAGTAGVYSIDLDGKLDAPNGAKGTLTFTIADTTVDVELDGTETDAAAVVTKLVDAYNRGTKLTDDGTGDFTATANDTKITFTAANEAAVSEGGTNPLAGKTLSVADKGLTSDITNKGITNDQVGVASNGSAATANFNLAGIAVDKAGKVEFAFDEKKYTVDVAADDDAAAIATKLVAEMNKDPITDEDAGAFTAAVDETTNTKIVLTAANDGPVKTALPTTFTVTGKGDDGNGDGEEVTGSGGVSFGSEEGSLNVAADSDLESALSKLDGADKDSTDKIDADEVTALKTAFPSSGTSGTQGKTSVTVSGSVDGETINESLTIDLGAAMATLKTDGNATVGELVTALKEAGEAAITAWESTGDNASKDYTFKLSWIATDSEGKNKLWEDTDTSSLALPQGVDGLYYGYSMVSKQDNGEGDTPVAAGKEGTINTGIQNPVDKSAGTRAQLANAAVDFTKADANVWSDGSKITIGDTTYTVALGADSKFKDAKNVVDLTGLTTTEVNNATTRKQKGAQALSVAANGNSIFTVGHDGSGKTTLQQKASAKESTDMTTADKFASYLGVSVADKDSLKGAAPGKGLVLQIGDTSDSYNQMSVAVGDMHTSGMGIEDIDISTQEGAAAAVQTIKNAINYVSSVRGDLGATQNRLEHTANNLSVMAENIQDAESTIRDTDVAEEMMSYVKNNILVQSAQAMLAQANQVPQGVLQLLG